MHRILKLINDGYSDYIIVDNTVNLLFRLFSYSLIEEKYSEANDYLELMKLLTNKHRYSIRSAELLKKMLIIDFLQLLIKNKLNKLDKNEISDLDEKFDTLDRTSYENEWEISCDFYLRGLELLKAFAIKDYNQIIKNINSLANRINIYDTDDYEMYILSYFVHETIGFIHRERYNIETDLVYEIKLFKRIYKILRNNAYRYDLFIGNTKNEILTYLEWLTSLKN